MADHSFNVLIWDSAQPERDARVRPNTRVPNFPRVARQQPDPRPASAPAQLSTMALSPAPSTPLSLSRSDIYPSSNPYHTRESPPANARTFLIDELGRFSTSEISDALIKLGLGHDARNAPVQHGGYIPDIHMLSPSPSDTVGQNTRVYGYAYTIK